MLNFDYLSFHPVSVRHDDSNLQLAISMHTYTHFCSSTTTSTYSSCLFAWLPCMDAARSCAACLRAINGIMTFNKQIVVHSILIIPFIMISLQTVAALSCMTNCHRCLACWPNSSTPHLVYKRSTECPASRRNSSSAWPLRSLLSSV